MAPGKKSKSAGVSAASFLNLKAEIAKQQDEFARNKAAGKSAIVGGVQRPDKVHFHRVSELLKTERHSRNPPSGLDKTKA
jgi:hypothetical protein